MVLGKFFVLSLGTCYTQGTWVYVLVTIYNDLYVLFFINSKEQENAGGVYDTASYVAYSPLMCMTTDSTLCLDMD